MPADNANSGELHYGVALPNWVVEGDAERLVECAVTAEAAGWDAVFLADHLIFPPLGPDETLDQEEYSDFPDPWITAAGIATRTDDIRIMSWITPVPRRQPWQLARNLATLDRLSDGRMMLGTGLGNPSDYTRFGRSWNPKQLGRKYDEALDVITGLWSGEPFSYDGEFYTIEEAVMGPTPVQEPRIPIIAGGLWPNKKPVQRGARWDGIVPHYRGDGILPEDGGGFLPSPDESLAPENEVEELLDYYHAHTDELGEIVLPLDPPHRSPEWVQWCKDRGATWLYARPKDDAGEWHLTKDWIRQGPPE